MTRSHLSRRRGERERGAILVESAIILPLFLLLVFGIIEFGIAYWTTGILDDGARKSGRVAAQVGRDSDYHRIISEAATAELQSLPSTAQPQWLLIYKANDLGFPGTQTAGGGMDFIGGLIECLNPSPSGQRTCTLVPWDATQKRFNWQGAAVFWDATEHSVCPEDGIDRIGVAFGINYKPTMGMFDQWLRQEGVNEWMIRWSVLAFEPGTSVVCGGPGGGG